MKKKLFGLITILSLVLGFTVLSCQVGLGEQVDIQEPRATFDGITPPSGAVVRGEFALRGDWSDDGKLKSINAKLTRKNDDFDRVYSYKAKIDKNQWIAVINPEKDHIIDGQYEVTVTFTDAAEHKKEIVRSLVIDNTAPIIVLQRPYSMNIEDDKLASRAAIKLDSYGQKISIEGQAADDNSVGLIEVSFYNEHDVIGVAKPLHTTELKNVPLSINEAVAVFKEKVDTEYTKIYGSNISEGAKNKTIKCVIRAYDKAKEYPIDGSPISEKGNCADKYYLYKNTLLENKEQLANILYETPINVIYQIENKIYENKNKNTADKIKNIKSVLAKNEITSSKFIINPDNSPRYFLQNFNQLQDVNSFGTTKKVGSKNDTITFVVEPGLDKFPIDIKSIEVFAYPVERKIGEDGEFIKKKEGVIHFKQDEMNTGMEVTESNGAVTVTLKITEDINRLQGGVDYVFDMDGTDTATHNIAKKGEGKGFGFYYTIAGEASGCILHDLEKESYKKGDSFTVSGELEYNAQTKLDLDKVAKKAKIELKLGSSEIKLTQKPVLTFEGKNKFKIPFNSLDMGLSSGNAKITVTLEDSEQGLAASSYSINFIYDVDKPTIKAQLEKGTVISEGKINSLIGSASDKSTSPLYVYYKLTQADGNVVSNETSKIEDLPKINDGSWTITDLPLGKTEGNVKLEVWTVDEVGNFSDHNIVDFIFDKTAPTVNISKKPDEIVKSQDVTIEGTVTETNDLDEKKSLVITVDGIENIIKGLSKDNNFNWSYVNKFNVGKHNISVVAYDMAGKKSFEEQFDFIVDIAAPIAKINPISDADLTSDNLVDVNKTVIVTGSLSDNTKLASAELQYSKADKADDSGWTKSVDINIENYNWSATLDTIKLNDRTQYFVRVYATDTAGNILRSEPKPIFVNQNSDRPLITFNDIALKDMNKDNFAQIQKQQIGGTIFDDDGIKYLGYYKDEKPNELTQIEIKNGSWSLDLNEGKEDICFKIIDANDIEWKSTNKTAETVTAEMIRLRGSNESVDSAYDRLNAIVDIGAPTFTENLSVNITNGIIKLGGKLSDTIADMVGWPEKIFTVYDNSEEKDINIEFNKENHEWTCNIETEEGEHSLRVVAQDSVGNKSEISRKVTVDRTPPTATKLALFNKKTQNDITLNDNNASCKDYWFNTNSIKIVVNIVENETGIAIVTATSGSEEVTLSLSKDKTSAEGYVTIPDGNNTIDLTLRDNAGNLTKINITDLKVDTQVPEIKIIDNQNLNVVQSINKLVSGVTDIAKDLVINVNAIDNGSSGMRSVTLKSVCEHNFEPPISPNELNTYKFTIPKNAFTTDIANKTGKVVFELEDNAGNKTNVETYSLTIDKQGPKSVIGNITDADTSTPKITDVNKTIQLSGIVKDDNINLRNDKPAKIEYSLDGDKWETVSDSVTISDSNWTADVDTTKITDSNHKVVDKQVCQFRLLAYDEAGNPGQTEEVKTVYINQESDRPTITFTNHVIGNILTSTNLLGSLIDDDGAVKSFEYSNDKGNSWTKIDVSNNGTWSLPLKEGANSLQFKVTENVLDEQKKNITWNEINLKSSNVNDAEVKKITDISVIVDTKAPNFNEISYFYNGHNGIDNIKNEVLGGTKNLLTVKISAEDGPNTLSDNAVVVKLDGNELKSVNKVNGFYEVTTTLSGTGFQTLQYTVTDQAGLSTTDSVQLNVDNTAPKVFFTDPQSSNEKGKEKYLAGNITARGSVDSPKTKLKYEITLSEDKPLLFNHDLTDAQTSWNLKFDTPEVIPGTGVTQKEVAEGEDAATTRHTMPMINWLKKLVDKRDNSNIDITTYSKIETLYLWIMAEDEVGNTSYNKLPMYVDPQGDRPILIVSNPPVSTENPIASASGSLSFFGSVVDTIGVNLGGQNIYMQLISDGHREEYNSNPKNTSKLDDYCNDTDEKNIITPTEKEKFILNKEDMLFMQKAFNDTLVNIRTGEEWNETVDKTKYADYGIKISVDENGTWNKEVNANDKFNAKKIGDKQKNINVVGARFFAKDKDGKISKSSFLNVKFDSSKPVISDLKLVNGNKSLTYSPNIYISGTTGWKLTGTITDNDKVASIRFKNKDVEGEPTQYIKNEGEQKAEVKFEYDLDSLTNKKAGSINILLDACDATSGRNTIEQLISFNVDNESPVISYKGEKGYAIVTEENGKNVIRQKNSFFTFGSRVTEAAVGTSNQSGFNFVAAYFKRGDDIINPLLTRDKNVSTTKDEPGKDVLLWTAEKDGLFWTAGQDATSINKKDNGTCSFTVDKIDSNVHANGLVKINETYYLINKSYKDGNLITIDGIPAGDTFKVQFANAFIINNPVQETGKSDAIISNDGYYAGPSEGNEKGDVINDDGDRMIEVASKTGARVDWEASICSKNIPDGEIELHYVVFDKAGNFTIGKENVADDNSYVSAYVMNNGPRIAGFKLEKYSRDAENKLKENADETIDSYSIRTAKNRDEFITSNPDLINADYTFDWDLRVHNKVNKNPLPTSRTYGDKDNMVTEIGDQTVIIPEIVGGNGAIFYKYEIGDSTLAVANKSEFTLEGINETPLINNGSFDYTAKEGGITIAKGDLLQIVPNDSTKAIPFKFTFADSTYKKAGYTDAAARFAEDEKDSQKADLTVYLKLKSGSGVPEVIINPLYWKDKWENSVYKDIYDQSLKGHIELPEYWKKGTGYTDAKEGIGDADPKLSGIVVIEGTVSDASGVDSVTVKIPGLREIKSETLTDEKIRDNLTDLNKGYALVTKVINSETVNWTLYWNTETIDKATNEAGETIWPKVGLDKEIKVTGTNNGKLSCTTGGKEPSINGNIFYKAPVSSGEKGTKSTFARYDIVPYIVGFSYDASPLGRASSGAFSLARGTHGIKFDGYNIAGSSKEVTASINDASGKSHTVTIGKKDICTVSDTAFSGNFVAKVGAIEAINSMNDNTAPYNREASDVLNIRDFSDDRYVHVWRDSIQDIFEGTFNCEYPTMSRDKYTGDLYAAYSTAGYGQIFISPNFVKDGTVGTSQYNKSEKGNLTGTGDKIPRRIYGWHTKPGDLDFKISTRTGKKGNLEFDAAYSADYKAPQDDMWVNDEQNYPGICSGGAYVYSDSFPTYGDIGRGDNAFHAFRGQLYAYDKAVGAFKNMKVLRSGDYVYSLYYDSYNGTINFSSYTTAIDTEGKISKLGCLTGFEGETSINSPYQGDSPSAGTKAGAANSSAPWIVIDGAKNTLKLPKNYYFNTSQKVGVNYRSLLYESFSEAASIKFEGNAKPDRRVLLGEPFKLSTDSFNKVSPTQNVSPYAELLLDNDGYPVIVYADQASGNIRIARTSSKSGTLGYVQTKELANEGTGGAFSYVTWTDDNGTNFVKELGTINKVAAPYEKPINRSNKWKINQLDVASKYGKASGSLAAAIDGDGYLHIVYKTNKDDRRFVYVKSTTSLNKDTYKDEIKFGSGKIIDKGSNIDITISDKKEVITNSKGETVYNDYVPYISYIGNADTYNGLKVAFPYDVNGDDKIDDGEFETMCAPATVLIQDKKNKVETVCKAADDKLYKLGVGYHSGSDYRVMFYVGKKETTAAALYTDTPSTSN